VTVGCSRTTLLYGVSKRKGLYMRSGRM